MTTVTGEKTSVDLQEEESPQPKKVKCSYKGPSVQVCEEFAHRALIPQEGNADPGLMS